MISACSGASGSPVRRRDAPHQFLEQLGHVLPGLGTHPHRVLGLDADDLLDLLDHLGRVGRRQVDLVQYRHHLEPLLDGRVAVGDALRLYALRGIHHQQRALAGRERARDLVGKIHVARRVDHVQLVGLAVARLVAQRDALRLDRDAALALQRHGVEHLGLHLAVLQAAAGLDEAVRQRRLAVVDVRDDREIADFVHRFGHPGGMPEQSGRLYLQRASHPRRLVTALADHPSRQREHRHSKAEFNGQRRIAIHVDDV